MSDEEKIQIAALGLLGLFGLAKRSGNAERLEAERREAERQEAERQEAERQEAERREAERKRKEAEAERQAKLEAERQEAERQEAERQKAEAEAEAERQRQEAERKRKEAEAEAERQRQEAERREAERQAKLEAERREAERKRKEAEAEAERQRQEAERQKAEAERQEAEREKETFTFRKFLVKFWNMFDTVDKDRNGILSKNELWTYLKANEQLKADLGASVEGGRARLFQAMDENKDGSFSRMEFAVYCAHKLFGTDPIEDEVAIRQFYYNNDPDTGGWNDITQDLIDDYRLQYDDNSDDEILVPPTPPTVESPASMTKSVLRDKNGEKFPDVRKGYLAARRKYRGNMKGTLFETTDGVYEVTKARGMRNSSQIKDEEYKKVTRPVTGPRINAFKPLQMNLRF